MEAAFWERLLAGSLRSGVSGKGGEGGPSFVFLWRLASSFAHVLLTSPLFPFLKEKMEVSLPEEERKKLMNAIPGGPGAEWVDENWLTYSKIPLDKIQIRRYAFYKLLKVI